MDFVVQTQAEGYEWAWICIRTPFYCKMQQLNKFEPQILDYQSSWGVQSLGTLSCWCSGVRISLLKQQQHTNETDATILYQ